MKIKQRKSKGQTLHHQIRRVILTFTFFPLIPIAFYFFYLIYHGQTDKLRQSLNEEINGQMENMQYQMRTIELMSRTIWSDTTFTTEVGQAAINDNLGEYNKYIFSNRTLSTLKVITSISQVQAARLHLDYPNLREYGRYLYHIDRAKNSTWYKDRDTLGYAGKWYYNSLDNEVHIGYSDYFAEKQMASYVVPVKVSNDLTGIFEIVLPMKALIPKLYTDQEDADVLLMDGQGRIYGLSSKSIYKDLTNVELLNFMKVDSVEELSDKTSTDSIDIYYGIMKKNPVILAAKKDTRGDRYIIKVMSIRAEVWLIFLEMLGVLILEMGMVCILYWAINRIVKSLLHDFDIFSDCMREVEKGNLNVKIPQLSQVEINSVAIEYNRMLATVQELMENAVNREVAIREAQIKSLEKQINSHFLYNVLDSIKMMAEVKGIYNVADALLALARMFRYNLRIDDHSVPLQEEIAYLESYLELCNIRYDYYITLRENIEENVKKLKVPKVILQPIAENSIKHGLDELAEDTTIYLKVYRKNSDIYIEMTDMGKGMNEEMLESVRNTIVNGGGGENSTNGIGLHNIHERLRLMYGESYGVKIYSKEGCYTKVALKIPEQEEL